MSKTAGRLQSTLRACRLGLSWLPAVLAVLCCGHDMLAAEEPTVHITSIPVGDGQIDVVTTRFARSKWLFCNLHDDEDTSVEAAKQVLEDRPGRLVELRHSGERIVAFPVENEEFRFDPNRIFTAAGVRKTLEDQSAWTKQAQGIVEAFGRELVKLYKLNSVTAVIALHNNTDARYSAASYLPGRELAKDAADVFIKPDSDPDDFFFVTDRRIFDALRRSGWNAVLQDNQQVTDDGSLSVYCGNHGIAYVNVEAEHGHLQEQIRMLTALCQVLNDLGLEASSAKAADQP